MTSYLLDTNVVSEMTKREPNAVLQQNLSRLAGGQVWVSVLTIGEMNKGVCLLPLGRRRLVLEQAFREFSTRYADRILPVSWEVVMVWGELSAVSRSRGFQLAPVDGLLAATAICHDLTVLTRNVRDFAFTGVPVINPWNAIQ